MRIVSGGTKEKFKQFTINCPEDSLVVLGSLIGGVITNLKKYKEYFEELSGLLKKYCQSESSSEEDILIPAKEYDDINDKLLFRQREIIKLMAEHQKASFSYNSIRPLLIKKGYIKHELDEDVKGLLSEFLDIRNWSFHNVQSRLVAYREAAEKRIPDEIKSMVKLTPQLNPVVITITKSYELIGLISLVIHVERRISEFELVLECMKKDYEEIYSELEYKPFLCSPQGFSNDVVYHELYTISRIDDVMSDVAQISMAIQKGKYDGTKEAFDKFVIKKDNE